MSKLSAIIIAKNADNVIADSLDSVDFADEKIVIDNNSDDKTSEIAKMKGAEVIKINTGSFADLRNLGAKKAKFEWILYLDSDERISSTLKDNIKKILSLNKLNFSAFRLQRKNFYFGKHEWPKIEKLERLFKKKDLLKWYGKLHETPSVKGEIGDIDTGYILHFTHRDLSSMLSKTIEWSKIEADLRFKAGHPKITWWRFPRVMLTSFYDSYIMQKGYKVGTVGIIESIYQAFSIFVTYARLWELQQSSAIHSEINIQD